VKLVLLTAQTDADAKEETTVFSLSSFSYYAAAAVTTVVHSVVATVVAITAALHFL